MKVFISGGCKNGKSYYAQRLAKEQQKKDLYYVATMRPGDEEDIERIGRHIHEREGWGFSTVEQYEDIDQILQICDPQGSFLLDSVTALLANEMYKKKEVNIAAGDKICWELQKVMNVIEDIVIVSDYIFSDCMVYDVLTEQYRKALAQIDKTAAAGCDVVLEVVYSNVVIHKGGELFEADHWGSLSREAYVCT